MNERTRAGTTDRTRTDIDKESGDWTEPELDEGADQVGDTGSRPRGDQVTHDQAETTPPKADRESEDRGEQSPA